MEKILFTSESVTEGHPDKVCDSISDAILDAMMAQDPMSRVACETATTTGLVLVMGEITTKANVDIQKIVRDTIREIGYDNADYGFDADTCAVITALDKQSTDIAMGVDKALEQKEDSMNEDELDSIGAGDQGLQFGYASNETEEYMPYAINMAHKAIFLLAVRLSLINSNSFLLSWYYFTITSGASSASSVVDPSLSTSATSLCGRHTIVSFTREIVPCLLQ